MTAEQYGRFLIDVFEEWVRRDVGSVFVQMFDVALANWVGEPPSLCIHSETCGLALALEHNGDLYSCDHFVEPALQARQHPRDADARARRLAAAAAVRPGQARHLLPDYCLDCDVRFACHGGCPKDRFISTPDGEPGLNYLCAGYKAFFHHVDRPMRFMSEQLRRDEAPSRDHERSTRGGRAARPERPVHLRLGTQVEAVPRSELTAAPTRGDGTSNPASSNRRLLPR